MYNNAKKEPPVNKCEFTGEVKTRGNYPAIKITRLTNGNAVARFTLDCKEYTGKADSNGNPEFKTTYIPVCAWTNSKISVNTLEQITPGMRLHIVGKWSNQRYKDKTGVDRNYTECQAYIIDVLSMPSVPVNYNQGGYYQQQPQQQPQQQQYQQQYQPQPQYQPQQQYPQGGYPQQPQNQYQSQSQQYSPQQQQYQAQQQQYQQNQYQQQQQQHQQQYQPQNQQNQQQGAPAYYIPPQQQQYQQQPGDEIGGKSIDI